MVCEESEKWVRAMMSEPGKVDDEEKKALLKEAAKRHGQLAREAGSAQGVDRHLLGMFLLLSLIHSRSFAYSFICFVRAEESHRRIRGSACALLRSVVRAVEPLEPEHVCGFLKAFRRVWLGRGGAGRIWRRVHDGLRRYVAILISPHCGASFQIFSLHRQVLLQHYVACRDAEW